MENMNNNFAADQYQENEQMQTQGQAKEAAGQEQAQEDGQQAPVVNFPTEKKQDHSMNYTHKFAEPVEIMGKKYTTMNFYFERLNGDDVEAVELELQQRNIVVLSAEVSSAFQSAIAARAAGIASDEIRRLPLRDYMKIKNAARNFLVAVGY